MRNEDRINFSNCAILAFEQPLQIRLVNLGGILMLKMSENTVCLLLQ